MKSNLDINREYSENYTQQSVETSVVPQFLRKYLKRNMNVVDLGCGDGGMIYGFKRERKNLRVVGVDISPRRIRHLKKDFPEYSFLCQDVCNTTLKDKSQDFVYASQVIEHVLNDRDMVAEIRRIAKMQAVIYIGSVIKKQWAIYKYKNRHGRFALDPTHEREYRSLEEFRDLLQVGGLEIIRIRQTPVMRKILKMNVRIPGFYIVEAVCKNEGY